MAAQNVAIAQSVVVDKERKELARLAGIAVTLRGMLRNAGTH